jgi:hypothetical protein
MSYSWDNNTARSDSDETVWRVVMWIFTAVPVVCAIVAMYYVFVKK